MKKTSAAPCGQNENKKLLFVFRLSLLLPILVLAVFCWGKTSAADESLKITAVQFDGGTGKANEDFIEITNVSDNAINLKGYRLAKITSSGKRYSIKSWTSDTSVAPGEKYVWANSQNDFAKNINANTSTTETISKDNTVVIIQGSLDDGVIIDSFIYKETSSNDDTPDTADDDTGNESAYAGQVAINEIYPAPNTKAGEKEFVEIENTSGKEIDFSTWCLKDKAANDKAESGNCKKIDATEKDGNFYVLSGSFSLNNDSKGDTVFLHDNNNILVDSRAYASTKSAYAYAFDGSVWRWTSQPTPGKENVFDKKLSGHISKDKVIYKNVYTTFEVKTDHDAQKFTWDFGDGHKSYLPKTKHKYAKTGTFHASLKISGNGEDALYEFDVKVKKYTAPRIRIVKLSPNPKGSDTDNEWIEIQNSSKKKINLKGWSVATGWDNLYNHPIRTDLKIAAGKTKKLLRDICAFTLANTKTKIELRDPSGKAVQKITYDSGKNSIQEDALFQKTDGRGWEWNLPPDVPSDPLGLSKQTQGVSKASSIPTGVGTAAPVDLGKYSINPAWQKKRTYQIALANFNSTLKIPDNINSNDPRVLGARNIAYDGNYYTFTRNISRKHWAVEFYESLWLKINSRMNRALNNI